jgi:AraC-like DNA-binding protein
MVPAQRRISRSGAVHARRSPIRDPELCLRYQQIVALMSGRKRQRCPPGSRNSCGRCRCAPPAAPLRATSALLFSRLATDLQAPPSLDKLAHEFALRKETLIRALKQDTGLTPASFINMARIEFAKTRCAPGMDRRRRLPGRVCRPEPFP